MWWHATKASLWSRLALASVVCVLPVAALTLYLAHARHQDEIEQLRSHAQLLVRFATHELGGAVSETRALLSQLVSEYELAAAGGLDCREVFGRALRVTSLYSQIAMADSQGRVTCAGKPLRGALQIGDREYFQQALETQQFVMSEALQGRDSRQWTIVAAHPLLGADGKPVAVLVAAFDLERLNERLALGTLPVPAIMSVVDRAGTIVARLPGGAGYAGKQIGEPGVFAADIVARNSGWSEATTLDGVVRLIAYERLPATPYYVRVGVPRRELAAAASPVLISGLVALGIVVALGITFAWAASQYLVATPIRRIMSSAQRLREGDLSSRTQLPYDHPVIGRLAETLDTLASRREQLTRAHKTLSGGNRTLLRERSEPRLLQEMCRVAVDVGGYPLAFVTYRQEDEARSVKVMAQYGKSDGFAESLHLSWGDDEHGRGTVGTAIRTGRHCIFRSVSDEPQFAPWREETLKRGFRSVISLPLAVEGAVIGTLTLFAPEEDAFDAAEVELLDEMAADLSFGIAAIRSDAKRVRAESLAERARTLDAITGLLNRAAFVKDAADVLGGSRGRAGAIVVLHLRRLQDVFDAFGYAPGDEVIREIGRRLLGTVGNEHRIGRISFSDFAVILPEADAGAVAQQAHAMRAVIDQPISINGASLAVQGAAGASFFPEHGEDAEVLIRRAAIAAREGGRLHAGYYKYRGGIERENPARLALAADLSAAIERDELFLHFQPKLEMSSNRISGKEGLLRWLHPQRGMISPAQFIPLAESTGQIQRISRLVLDAGIRQQSEWQKSGGAVPVALNLSARNLQDRRYVQSIAQRLEKYGVSPELIDFEITETSLIDDSIGARQVLKGIRDLGARIYVDDFGAGYCALSYLTALPVNGLKIDRSFIAQMTQSDRAHSVVASIITMAHELGLVVVAEGVETRAQFEALKALSCDEVQGYYIGRPVPA